MRRLIALLVVGLLSSSALAADFDYQTLAGKYGFDWTHTPKHCLKADAKLVKTLQTEKYSCTPPKDGSASGKPVSVVCASPGDKHEYLFFDKQADCTDELETQRANGP